MIAGRQIPPGTRLVQATLAKQLGTSAMPVIEALRRLERDGLVSHVPHLGSFVRESTVEDLREFFCIRRGLETEACRLFVHRATPEEKRRLSDLNDKLNQMASGGDLEEYLETDLAFHMHIVDCARVSRLKEIIESRHIEERIFRNAPELQGDGSTAHLVGIHDPIVQAILDGDEDAAAEVMRQHLLDAERQYLKVAGTQ
jgi:DNA-binding GntR family transcriptional regulator